MPVKNGDTVKVHYRGTLSDGTEFDSSQGQPPLEFTLGRQMLIPGFEKAVLGLSKGDKTTVTIPAVDAYGESLDELVMSLPLDQVPDDVTPEIGMVVQVETTDGNNLEAVVREVADKHILLDANHPLAGQDLTFEIEVVEIC